MSACVRLIFFAAVAMTALNSCAVSRFLKDAPADLLTKNNVKILDGKNVKNKGTLRYELSTLYQQKPNENSFGFFKLGLWTHYKLAHSEHLEATENGLERAIRKFAKRSIAEEPSYFVEDKAESTAQSMEYYLQNRGYFDAEVFFDKLNYGKRKVSVTYFAQLNKLYLIDTVEFKSEDAEIHALLQQIAPQSFLKKNQAVDGRLYDQEVTRITRHLKNNGYAYFTANYVAPLDADTTNYRAKLVLEVLQPGRGRTHKKYNFGEITVTPNYNPLLDSTEKQKELIGDLYFVKPPESTYWVKPNVLNEVISIRPGLLYDQEEVDRTNRQLSNLGVYRFVSIRQSEDTLHGRELDFEIELTPGKRWEFGYDLEMNNTERNLTGNRLNFFGFTTGLSLNSRNLFKGAELFFGNGTFGSEINFSAKNKKNFRELFNTIDAGIKVDFFKPRFMDYMGVYRMLARNRIIRKSFWESLKEKSPTRISIGYNYLSLYNFYNYHLFNTSFGYDLQKLGNRYIINHFAIDYLNPTTEAPFDTLLSGNPFLAKSFGKQLFTGFLFKDFSYIFNSRTNRFGESHYFQINTELSGLEVWAVNSAYNNITGRNAVFKLADTVEYSQFFKAEIDLRHYRQFTPRHGFAVRLNVGIARPFGFSKEVPYVKQFYVGGPQSLRAWGARGLGPGSYRDPLTEDSDNRLLFYQTGDLKFEFNTEYRFDMFKIFSVVSKGAVFLDIGNVWIVKEDPQRPGGQIRWRSKKLEDGTIVGDNFLKQMAIGTGFGFRFDFNYFLLRLDLGYRIKNPYKTQVGSNPDKFTYLAYSTWKQHSIGDINYNLGINYPF